VLTSVVNRALCISWRLKLRRKDIKKGKKAKKGKPPGSSDNEERVVQGLSRRSSTKEEGELPIATRNGTVMVNRIVVTTFNLNLNVGNA
jgi:hypothetical protein